MSKFKTLEEHLEEKQTLISLNDKIQCMLLVVLFIIAISGMLSYVYFEEFWEYI